MVKDTDAKKDAEQLKRFKKTAEELGVDESGVAFEKAMKSIAKTAHIRQMSQRTKKRK